MFKKKIKVGDKVRIVRNSDSIRIGEIAEVIVNDGSGVFPIRVRYADNYTEVFNPEDLKMVDATTRVRSPKSPKERVYHTEDAKQEALAYWRSHPSRPKAAIARKFGINPGTFNMWTREEGRNDSSMSVDLSGLPLSKVKVNGVEHTVMADGIVTIPAGSSRGSTDELLTSILDELKKINARYK